MLIQMSRIIAEFFVSVATDLYYTEPRMPPWSLFEGTGLFVRKQLEGGGLIEGEDLIESLQYNFACSIFL